MNSQLRGFFTVFFDLLIPPRASESVVQRLTLTQLYNLAQGESTLPYHDTAATALVWELKYRKNPSAAALAGAFLAEELLAIAAEELGKPLLIPVPMHKKRRRERGYNQTELLCEAALQNFSDRNSFQKVQSSVFEYVPDVLVRTRATPPQQGLQKQERLKNIKNSMRAEGPGAGRIAGRVCVVVDDVTTTGATFEECKRALKLAGARVVHCVALARS